MSFNLTFHKKLTFTEVYYWSKMQGVLQFCLIFCTKIFGLEEQTTHTAFL